MFEGLDSGVSEALVEVRHPFMDIRMLKFLLSVPVIPWCRDKYLIRRSMRPLLPPEITERPKTGVQGFPFFAIWNRQEVKPSLLKSSLADLASIRELLAHYVDLEALNRATSSSRQSLAVNLRPRALAFFLRSLTL
jgi:asparagine synthase (glutamine-hydrolysing)